MADVNDLFITEDDLEILENDERIEEQFTEAVSDVSMK